MSIEPVRLHRRKFVYNPYMSVPVDFFDVYLPDRAAPALPYWVTVRIAYRRDANPASPKTYLRNAMGNQIWAQNFLAILKASPIGTISFVPPTPGFYTVEVAPIPAGGITPADYWETKPIEVVP